MDTGNLIGIITLIFLVVFVAIVFWAYSSRRKKDFEQAANLPLEDDDESINNGNNKPNRPNRRSDGSDTR